MAPWIATLSTTRSTLGSKSWLWISSNWFWWIALDFSRKISLNWLESPSLPPCISSLDSWVKTTRPNLYRLREDLLVRKNIPQFRVHMHALFKCSASKSKRLFSCQLISQIRIPLSRPLQHPLKFSFGIELLRVNRADNPILNKLSVPSTSNSMSCQRR